MTDHASSIQTATSPVVPVVIRHSQLAENGDYSIGLTPYYTPGVALDAAEAICYRANRLTAPFHGIQTRDSVFQDEEGYYHTIVFPIPE